MSGLGNDKTKVAALLEIASGKLTTKVTYLKLSFAILSLCCVFKLRFYNDSFC